MTGAVLAGRALTLSFGTTRVLSEVDFRIHPGEIVAVMGPSGSGKSSLLHCLAGLLRPDSGTVHLAGGRIDDLSERRRSELRLHRMGFVFQFGDLVPELTLADNVALPLWLTGVARAAAARRARNVLASLEIDHVADRRVNEVSGGQAQRAAVARALVHRPSVIFADEPTGAVDTHAGELVLEALVGAAHQADAAVVLVTHELRVAAYGDREVILRDGSVAAAATVAP